MFSAVWSQWCQLQQVTYSSLSCKPRVKWFHEKTLLASSLTLFKRGNSIDSCGQDISRNKYASWKISEIRAFPVLSSKNTDKYTKNKIIFINPNQIKTRHHLHIQLHYSLLFCTNSCDQVSQSWLDNQLLWPSVGL